MYSPKINEKLIPELYRLKQITKQPMTKMVNEAVAVYINKQNQLNPKSRVLEIKHGEKQNELGNN